MKKSFKLSLILLTLFLFSCQDIVEKKCNAACDQFVSCTEQVMKIELSPEAKRSGHISCLNGCATHNSEILQCYEQEPTSCKGFGECVLQIGSLE
ncbi:Cys-rich protein [Leptospira idonii]|uniref:Cys-rich protein n=1 Tax=Leptospira idonii TaxID=1193500 RepID=A0A4R9M1Y7_9LEPT|nr:Cys-rich protein [Leptospira idonii]TGN20102.1 Cys-rich protein [Leptospira idonii]